MFVRFESVVVVLRRPGEGEVSGRHESEKRHSGGSDAWSEEQQGRARDEGCDREKK